jgi:Uncharacterised nucleotidyltransferase
MNPGGAGPLADVEAEAERVLAAAAADRVTVRLLGGVAIARHRHGPVPETLRRSYADIDLVVRRHHDRSLRMTLERLGYEPNRRFNSLHGDRRLLFYDHTNGRQLDVFVGRFQMCHTLELNDRLDLDPATLCPTDLLLTKLQVQEITHKDLLDSVTLLRDHEITPADRSDTLGLDRLVELTSREWGWYTTVSDNLARLGPAADELLEPGAAAVVANRVGAIAAAITSAPKSLRWRARARLGRRVPWYELPEEVARPVG